MLEDKLNREERIRLEALAQANASLVGQPHPIVGQQNKAERIIDRAKVFEDYIRNGAKEEHGQR